MAASPQLYVRRMVFSAAEHVRFRVKDNHMLGDGKMGDKSFDLGVIRGTSLTFTANVTFDVSVQPPQEDLFQLRIAG